MSLTEETKYALEAVISEIGTTLPGRFTWRMLQIGTPYIDIARVHGIWCNNRSHIADSIETIVYHASHGSSVEEIKEEMQRLLNRFDLLEALSPINRETHGMELA